MHYWEHGNFQNWKYGDIKCGEYGHTEDWEFGDVRYCGCKDIQYWEYGIIKYCKVIRGYAILGLRGYPILGIRISNGGNTKTSSVGNEPIETNNMKD